MFNFIQEINTIILGYLKVAFESLVSFTNSNVVFNWLYNFINSATVSIKEATNWVLSLYPKPVNIVSLLFVIAVVVIATTFAIVEQSKFKKIKR